MEAMKIAVVTDNEETISAHFGRATKYMVFSIEEGQVVSREIREKASHRDFSCGHHHEREGHGRHGMGRHSRGKHQQMFENIQDCELVLTRGMGQGAYQGLKELGKQPILTEISDIETAVQAVLAGSIVDHPERLH
jgi:predicted Fe-Mo cluster-binding NifX family protein